jgi:hypothetical protein
MAVDYNRYLIYKFCFSESNQRKSVQIIHITFIKIWPKQEGPCLHDMPRPQVADGGTASYKEGSFEYIE